MDIIFSKLDPNTFEELCFELILKFNFEEVHWRGGTNDRGRDIEAKLLINQPLIPNYYEHWHFECKHFSNAVSKSKLLEKIEWADANNPDKLVFIISSYISNDTKLWLEKIKSSKPYFIEIIEGYQLRKIVERFPQVRRKFFAKGDIGYLKEQMKTWLIYDREPPSTSIKELLTYLDMKNLTNSELVFLLSSALMMHDRIFDGHEIFFDFKFDSIMSEFKNRTKSFKKRIVEKNAAINWFKKTSGSFNANKHEYEFCVSECYLSINDTVTAYYCVMGEDSGWWDFTNDSPFTGEQKKGFEMVIFADSSFTTRFGAIEKNSYEYFNDLNYYP